MPLELAISQIVFCVFALLAIAGAIGVVGFRNPVTSAMSMAVSFISVAAIFFGMGAEFMGIVQITVYVGAILVLFIFVVMMLDVKKEEKTRASFPMALIGTVVAGIFAGLVANVSLALPGVQNQPCPVGTVCTSLCDTLFDAEAATKQVADAPVIVATAENFGGQLPTLNKGEKTDVALVGQTLYKDYNIQLVILSFALLSACVGSIALSRKLRKD